MAHQEDWTLDDDARLRGALASLRADVDALPLPDVRFVRARGVRRRRQRALAFTAAAAAAAIVVGAVGYGQLGRDTTLPVQPATRTSGSVSTALPTDSATTDPLDQPGPMPLLTDWISSLGLKGASGLTTQNPKSSDYRNHECLTTIPGGQVLRQEVTLDAGGFQGGQTQFAVSSSQDPTTVAEGLASDIAGCQQGPGFKVTPVTSSGWPRLFSYTAGDAGSGWFAVVPGTSDVTLIQVVDPTHATSVFTQAQVAALADIAEKRLARYGSGASGSTGTTTGSIGAPTGTTKALSEDMPVAGPPPVPGSPLFVAASQWRSDGFLAGATTRATPADSAAGIGDIGAFCETDAYLSGIGGQVGVVTVQAGTGDANVIGRQRVRVDSSADDTEKRNAMGSQVADELAILSKGCTESDGKVVATPGPSRGTFLLTKSVTGEATGKDYRWVGVTPLNTPGAWTTIIFHGTSDGQGFTGRADQGFAELDRLLMLARQK